MVTTFTIERDKWGTSQLVNPNGTFCCLGFYGLALGLTRSQMGDAAVPATCPDYRQHPEAGWLRGEASVCNKLVEINDSKTLSRSERERGVAAGFALAGITVNFTG